MKSFREAWVNACLHTKWEKMNPPAVYVFNDRIEIISTGGLPSDLSKEEFYRGISRPVNTKLQKVFGQLGYVEQTGHGVPMITQMYGRQAFEIMDNYINVTIPFSRNLHDKTENSHLADINPMQRRIIDILRDNPEITIKDMVKSSGLSDGYVRKILGQLKEAGILVREGSNKTGHWKIVSRE